MNYALCQDAAVLAQGVMDFSDTYSFIEGEPIPIVVELTGLVHVTMEATVSFSNMSRYVQVCTLLL